MKDAEGRPADIAMDSPQTPAQAAHQPASITGLEVQLSHALREPSPVLSPVAIHKLFGFTCA